MSKAGMGSSVFVRTKSDISPNTSRNRIMQIGLRTVLMLIVLAMSALAWAKPSDNLETQPAKITLYPAPEAKPALKYQLLPPILDRRPGNAAVWWNRMLAERTTFFANFFFGKSGEWGGQWKDVEKWMDIPLGNPREKQFREKADKMIGLRSSNSLFGDMDRAARFDSCDWEQTVHEGNYIAMLLPEIQQSRSYARLLSAKAHFEIAEGRYDEAVRTLQTGYSEARQVAQSPTIVSWLIGVTIAGIMSNQVQQAIQQPDAPNLYWALSTLPRPLVDLRLAGETESNILYLEFPELRDLDKKKLPPDAWRDLLEKTQRHVAEVEAYIAKYSHPEDSTKIKVATKSLSVEAIYPRAKQYLVDHGQPAKEVKAMPVEQVVLLYSVKLYNERSDELFKWFFLPAWEGGSRWQQAEQLQSSAANAEVGIFPAKFSYSFWQPAIGLAKEAEARMQWVVAALRIFEAMRLYAANHEGHWPERLTDITEVPVPLNPYDGKPFVYERHGDTVVLTFAERGPKNWHQRFEITLKHGQTATNAAKHGS
jgi:hypothetical protein